MNEIAIQCKLVGVLSILSGYIVFADREIRYTANLSIIDLSCCYLYYIVAFLLLLFGFYCMFYKPKNL